MDCICVWVGCISVGECDFISDGWGHPPLNNTYFF